MAEVQAAEPEVAEAVVEEEVAAATGEDVAEVAAEVEEE